MNNYSCGDPANRSGRVVEDERQDDQGIDWREEEKNVSNLVQSTRFAPEIQSSTSDPNILDDATSSSWLQVVEVGQPNVIIHIIALEGDEERGEKVVALLFIVAELLTLRLRTFVDFSNFEKPLLRKKMSGENVLPTPSS